MGKLYCVVNDDEGWVETPGHKTKKEAVKWWEDTTGVKLDTSFYTVQAFTKEELEKLPED